jgi:hypothetical protein
MVELTQAAIDDLISCRKTIINPPKRGWSIASGSRRKDMSVQSATGDRFGIFMRVSEAFDEDFSIGLRYDIPDNGSIILLRCNGPHGNVVNAIDGVPHWGYHIHIAREHNLSMGRKAEAGAEITTEFASYQQALRYFVQRVNVQWSDGDFPGLSQRGLFEDDE